MLHSRGLLDGLFSTESMCVIFSDREQVQTMLAFEAALAQVEARLGIIPAEAAARIADQCHAEHFDLDALAGAAAQSGNLAIPVVRALTSLVAADAPKAADYVHWGATSQDMLDTSLVLRIRQALQTIEADLGRLAEEYTRLARAHTTTVMAGRTWMQHAAPITFGLKVAAWLSAIQRDQQRLRELRSRALVLQFGGAVGTLAAFGSQGLAVAADLARELELGLPDIPWHTQRDRVVEVATVLGLLVGTLGKVARDLSLLVQTEVDEAREPPAPGRGGSSSMPQKRNPVGAAVALAAAQRVPGLVATLLAAMPQEHERGLGGWQAEWETLPTIFLLTAGALAQMLHVAEGLEVNAPRMRANLDLNQGLIFAEAAANALAPHVGRPRAHELVTAATRRAMDHSLPLRDALGEDPAVTAHLAPPDFDRIFDPLHALGVANQLVRRVTDARDHKA